MFDWWTDHKEIAALIRFLNEKSPLSIDDAAYLVEKPWKWATEYLSMLAERAASPEPMTDTPAGAK